jgi:hypothetical protein
MNDCEPDLWAPAARPRAVNIFELGLWGRDRPEQLVAAGLRTRPSGSADRAWRPTNDLTRNLIGND